MADDPPTIRYTEPNQDMSQSDPPSQTSTGGQQTGRHTPGRRVMFHASVDEGAEQRKRERSEERHQLDEAGIDPEAFRTLATALAQHRRSEEVQTPTSATPMTNAPPVAPAPTADQVAESAHQERLTENREVYIDPDERAGLPAPLAGDDRNEHDVAAGLVRAHTRRGIFGKFRLPSKSAKTQEARQKESYGRGRGRNYGDQTPDIEHVAASNAHGLQAGGGILSALLALYGQDSDNMSDTTSVNTSRAGTPAPRGTGRMSRDSSPERSGRSRRRMHMPNVPQMFNMERRPSAERSDAGVLGALIATTANISAAAAPANSTIVPNIKRPGYKLSRYSLDATNDPQAFRPRHHGASKSETLTPGVANQYSSSPLATPTHENGVPGHQINRTSTGSSFPFHEASKSNDYAGTSSGDTAPTPSYKSKWGAMMQDLPALHTPGLYGHHTPSGARTPATETDTDGEHDYFNEKRRHDRERRKHKKKAEIFITRHISDLLARQTFICKLARAMMMFGGPTHRLQAQILSTGRVLEVSLSCMYLPDTMLLSFDDEITSTSNIKLIKQASALDLTKLTYAYKTYWGVIHDEISVKDASAELDDLMRAKSTYPTWALVIFGGMASAAISVNSFSGSFIDALVCFPLGALLVFIQTQSGKNELYSNMFEISMCMLISFIAAGLSQTHKLCFPAIASGSVVLILPGYIVLCGSLELSSRNIVSGSVRLCYAIIYSLFLGFGLAIGLEIYEKMTNSDIASSAVDYTCSNSHDQSLWYRATPSLWWNFLLVPMYALFLSLRNHAPWNRKEIVLLVSLACVGWVTNHFVTTAFPNQNDISSAVGAFAVGFLANVYGRFFRGNAFVIMITGIMFQLPSGLSNGGLITFASNSTDGDSNSYLSGFQTALQLVSTCIGMTVGLGISLVVVFPIQSRKRAGGVFSL